MSIEAATASVKTFMMFNASNERTVILLVLFDITEMGYYYMRIMHRLIGCLSEEIDQRTLVAREALSTRDEGSRRMLSMTKKGVEIEKQLSLCSRKDLALGLIARDAETMYLSVSMFFCEVVEFIVPLITTLVTVILYYFPTGIRSQMMNIADLSPEEFQTGVQWNLLSIAVDGVLFVVLEKAMLKFCHTQVVVNGLYFFQRDSHSLLAVMYLAMLPFLVAFLWHNGCDPYFEFEWLTDGGNSTSTG